MNNLIIKPISHKAYENYEAPMLGRLSVVLVHHHTFAWGPSHALGEFLSKKACQLMFFEFPFEHHRFKQCSIRKFRTGILISTVLVKTPILPEYLQYMWHLYKVVLVLLCTHEKHDMFVGVDPLNAFAGLIVKHLGRIRKVVYYAIDFVPQRFPNPIANTLYHCMTKTVLRRADMIWNMTKRMEMTWVWRYGIKPEKNIQVPTGFFQEEIADIDTSKRQNKLLIFAGSISPSKGIDLVLNAVSDLVKSIPDIKLVIVGGGSYEKGLRERVKKLGLSEYVKVLGYIPNHRKMLEIMSIGSVGLATYKPDPNSLAWYGDPGRIKEYLALGMPVITTNVPEISMRLRKAKAGIVIPYDKQSLVDAVIKITTDQKLLAEMSINAIALSKIFEYNNMFSVAIRKTVYLEER